MNTINTRRSIRRYAKREVSEELLNRLLTEAMRTQTMGNLQFYSVVVTRSDEQKQRLAPAHFNQPMVTQAPVVLTFCADTRRMTAWADKPLRATTTCCLTKMQPPMPCSSARPSATLPRRRGLAAASLAQRYICLR